MDTEIAHVTRDSDTTFKVKRSKVNLQGAKAYSGGLPHGLLSSLSSSELSVSLPNEFVCLSALVDSLLDITITQKKYARDFHKIRWKGGMAHGPRKKPLYVGGNPHHVTLVLGLRL